MDIEQAQKQLKNIESSLKGTITQIENSSIEVEIKSSLVADLEEITFEVHHLVPVERE